MRIPGKRLGKWILWSVILFFPLTFLTNYLSRILLVRSLETFAGLKASVGGVSVGMFKAGVRVKNLKVFQPEPFSPGVMADIPEIYVSYRPLSLLRRKLVFPEMRVYLRELYLVRNRNGDLNFRYLLRREREGEIFPSPGEGMLSFRIEELRLRIDRIVFKDYLRGNPPRVREFRVDMEETFHNVTDFSSLGRQILSRLLEKTALKSLLVSPPLRLFSPLKDIFERLFSSPEDFTP